MTPKSQYFNGYKFTRGAEGTYYRCAVLKERMHRYVWKFYNGDIPDGYDIHHIDGDKSNNDITNLQLIESARHRKLHGEQLSDVERERRRTNMNEVARPKAIEWHKSSDGSKWHSEHLKQQRKNGTFKKQLVCTQCGKQYIGEVQKLDGNTFCSNSCRTAYRRKLGVDNIEKSCPVCGRMFQTNKYRPTVTCSRSCANRYRRVCYEGKVGEKN